MSRKSSEEKSQADLFLAPARDWDELERVYGKSARTLKRYDQTGRQVGDPCPLEEPEKMPDWWQKHMKQQVPAVILAAAKGKAAPAAAVEVKSEPVNEPDETPMDEPVGEDEMGLERTLERLARVEVQLSRKATKSGQTKAWLDTVSRMSTVAEKLRIEAVRVGKLLPRDQVEEAIHSFHGPVEREIRLLYREMCSVLGLPPSPEREAKWNEAVDAVFRKFSEEVLR